MPNEFDHVFINNALEDGFKKYIANKDKKESLEYNSFLCSIIRMLFLIYGDELVLSYNNKDVAKFDSILESYGFSSVDVINFKTVCDKFYQFDVKQQKKAIKKKNKYFNLVQKYLIDMMLCKINKETVDGTLKKEFYDLLFTANSNDFYRKSTAVLLAYNPYEIDEYAKKQNIFQWGIV